MKISILSVCLAISAPAASAAVLPRAALPLVTIKDLESDISTSALSKKAHELEQIAYSTKNRNRVLGSRGHELTVEWVTGYLDEMKDYYTYEVQSFEALYARTVGNLTIFGNDVGEPFEYSPGGSVEAEFVAVAKLGCEAKNYPKSLDGKIALISRGECEFGQKSAFAGGAGAIGAVIYNNLPGPIGGGTLGPPPRPEGPYVPTFSIAKDKGERILAALDAGDSVEATIEATADIRNVTTYVSLRQKP